MKLDNRAANIEYSLAQSGYWMSLCAAVSCAAVFLQARGYTNSQLGLVLAAGNAAGFILSIYLGGVVDRSEKVDTVDMLWILLIAQGLIIVSLFFLPGRSAALSVCYSLYLTVNVCIIPLINQLCFDLNTIGCDINYGVDRGIGSLAYALCAAALGALVDRFGTELLIPAGLVIDGLQMVVLFFITLRFRRSTVSRVADTVTERGSSMLSFVKDNSRFCLLMLGLMLMWFTYRLFDNFLINIVRNVGGGTQDMGNLNAFMAVLELPAMFLYARIAKRQSASRSIRIALVFLAVKALCIALSTTLPMLFAAHSVQAVSYALLTPAQVDYTNKIIPRKDATRGQSLSYAVSTVGGIFATFFGGRMYDTLGVRPTLMIGVAVSVIGMAVSQLAVEKTPVES